MFKKININELYLVLISSHKFIEPLKNNIAIYHSKKIKFAVVKYLRVGIYEDVLSKKCYKSSIDEFDSFGTMFVNNNYYIIPISSILELDDNFIKEKKFLELIKGPLVKLNKFINSENEDEIKDIKTIYNAFREEKVKILNKRRSKNEKNI